MVSIHAKEKEKEKKQRDPKERFGGGGINSGGTRFF